MSPVSTATVGLLIRSLAAASRQPGVFGTGFAKLGPILDTIASLAEVPEATEQNRQAMIEMVDRWVQENRAPTDAELEALKSTRDELDARAKAVLADLPPKGAKAWPFVAMALLGLLMLGGFAPRAEAQTPPTATLVLKWVNPTQYTTGAQIAPGELVGTRVVWGTCSGSAFTKQGEHKLGVVTTDTVTGLTPGGKYCASVFASALKAGDKDPPAESAMANLVSIEFPLPDVHTPPPNAPTSVTVTCTIDGKTVTCTGTIQ